jgi:hypothetical protein
MWWYEEGVGGHPDHLEGTKGFVGGSSPIQDKVREQEAQQPGYKVNYMNLRAQCYYTLAEVVREHKLAIPAPTKNSRRPLSRRWSR